MSKAGVQTNRIFDDDLHEYALGMLMLEPVLDQLGKFSIVGIASGGKTDREGEIVNALSVEFPTRIAGIDIPIGLAIRLEQLNGAIKPDAFVLGEFENVGVGYRQPLVFYKLS